MPAAAPSRLVVVVGDVMTDIVVRPEGPLLPGTDRRARIEQHPGGSGANQAAWMAAAGLPIRFAGRVGAADADRMAADLVRHGVDARLARDPDRPSGTLIAVIGPDGERSFLTDRGANDGLCWRDLPEALLDGAALLHVSGYALVAPGPRAAVLALIEAAHRHRLPVTIDPGSAGFLAEIGPSAFLAWTAGVSLCCLNADEAACLAGTAEPEGQMAALLGAYEQVVIKRGALGAEAGDARGGRWHALAGAVEVVDTTGAGDAFLAAIVTGLVGGLPLAAVLPQAVAAGSRAVTQLGGRPPADGGQRLRA